MLPLNIQRLFSVDEVTYYNTRQLKNMKQLHIRYIAASGESVLTTCLT